MGFGGSSPLLTGCSRSPRNIDNDIGAMGFTNGLAAPLGEPIFITVLYAGSIDSDNISRVSNPRGSSMGATDSLLFANHSAACNDDGFFWYGTSAKDTPAPFLGAARSLRIQSDGVDRSGTG